MNHERELGFASIKTIFLLLILGSALYLGFSVVPVYYNNFELEENMRDTAKFARQNHQTPAELRRIVYKEAQSLEIPVSPEDIRVEMGPNGVFIGTDYTVEVNLHVYGFTLQFKPSSVAP